ncbi:MAG: hypothetical protein IJ282_06905 [Lachnospiraceae bacterium]|nr:hypothetical protein [Lachnospiraceae bacterium]
MSYCVNCGVELGGGLEECPLCNTPVINPKELEKVTVRPAFPREKGQAEPIRKKDMWLLITVVAVVTAVTCVLLNILVYDSSPWSLAIVGACALLWVMLIPATVPLKFPVYIYLFWDGVMLSVYLYMLTYMTAGQVWFWRLGLPFVILLTVVAEVFAFCMKHLPRGFLVTALYIITSIGVICSGLESLIDLIVLERISLKWSAIVLTVCVIIDATIVTLLSVKRFRNAIRRRLHF